MLIIRELAFLIIFISALTPVSAGDVVKIALLGDSMTWLGGPDFSNPRGWTHYLTDIPAEMKLYARSGATWTNTSSTKINPEAYSEVIDDDNVIYNQIMRLEADSATFSPDIVIVFAGTNDAWFDTRRPGIFSDFSPSHPDIEADIDMNTALSRCTTLATSVRLACSVLSDAFPESEICIITPVKSKKIDDNKISLVSDIISRGAEEFGFHVVRGDREVESVSTYDGVHTDEKGARTLSEIVRKRIIKTDTD